MAVVAPPTEEGLKRCVFTLNSASIGESLRADHVSELAAKLQAKG